MTKENSIHLGAETYSTPWGNTTRNIVFDTTELPRGRNTDEMLSPEMESAIKKMDEFLETLPPSKSKSGSSESWQQQWFKDKMDKGDESLFTLFPTHIYDDPSIIVRTIRILERAEIKSRSELKKCDPEDLKGIYLFGDKMVEVARVMIDLIKAHKE